MNGRFAKFLIFILCGALLLIAGCTTTAPSGGGVQTPAGGTTTTQVAAASPDLGTIITLLRTISDQVSLVAENTRPPGKGIVTGNIALFDNGGDTANTITDGTSVIALPQGSCDIAVFGDSLQTFITIEEMKDYGSTKYSRNYQACAGVYLCRRTVTLDDDFSYLYLTYKPYDSTKRLTGVTLSYRCKPL
jgi:hypothetical protein